MEKYSFYEIATYRIERGHNKNVFHAIVYRRNSYFMSLFMTAMNFIDVLIPSKYLFFRVPKKITFFRQGTDIIS